MRNARVLVWGYEQRTTSDGYRSSEYLRGYLELRSDGRLAVNGFLYFSTATSPPSVYAVADISANFTHLRLAVSGKLYRGLVTVEGEEEGGEDEEEGGKGVSYMDGSLTGHVELVDLPGVPGGYSRFNIGECEYYSQEEYQGYKEYRRFRLNATSS